MGVWRSSDGTDTLATSRAAAMSASRTRIAAVADASAAISRRSSGSMALAASALLKSAQMPSEAITKQRIW